MNSALSSGTRLRVSPSPSLPSLDFLAIVLETSSFALFLEETRMTAVGLLEAESMELSRREEAAAEAETAAQAFESPGREARWGRR